MKDRSDEAGSHAETQPQNVGLGRDSWLGLRVLLRLGFRVEGLGFRVQGLGFF